MFESMSETEEKAASLMRAYSSWVKGEVQEILRRKSGPVMVIEVEALKDRAASYARLANTIIAATDFSLLEAKVQRDITAIAEEALKGAAEIEIESDPDEVFRRLPKEEKRIAVQRCPSSREKTDRLASRFELEIRKQEKREAVLIPQNGPLLDPSASKK